MDNQNLNSQNQTVQPDLNQQDLVQQNSMQQDSMQMNEMQINEMQTNTVQQEFAPQESGKKQKKQKPEKQAKVKQPKQKKQKNVDPGRRILKGWIIAFSIIMFLLVFVLVDALYRLEYFGDGKGEGIIQVAMNQLGIGEKEPEVASNGNTKEEEDENENESDKETTETGKTEVDNTIQNNTQTSLAGIRNPLCTPKGNGEDTITIMLYFNGSNLETDYGAATDDIAEVLKAPESDKINIVLETISTREWQDYNIASDHTQRYLVEHGGLTLVDDSLGQQDVTNPDALSGFVRWSVANYPADRYFLILWDHGGGAVDGFGYNEWGNANDALTIDEMQDALDKTNVKFDFIGFDACIMSAMEISYALYDYCDYTILSEDFESSIGWYYTNWLTELSKDTSMSVEDMGKILVDDMVSENERRHTGEATLALIDERYIPTLFKSWKNFAFENEAQLLAMDYSVEVTRSSRAINRGTSDMQESYITDMMALASSIPSSSSKALALALKNAICYYECSEDDIGLTGLSVCLPYNDRRFYGELRDIFLACGISKDYVIWLEKFTDARNVEQYDYGEFEESWDGWDNVEG